MSEQSPVPEQQPARTIPEIVDERRKIYADTWANDAAGHEAGGHYAWMAGAIEGYQRVLEIGTGDARGTTELLARGHSIVTIEVNPDCFELAHVRLRDEQTRGADCRGQLYTARRGRLVEVAGGFTMEYRPMTPLPRSTDEAVVLIEGDVLSDRSLWQWLETIPPRDAVICWLIGVHSAVHLDAGLAGIDVAQASYRGHVQRAACALADRVLRPGGVMHIVDRIKPFEDAEDEEAITDLYRGLTEGTSLVLTAMNRQPYERSERGVELVHGSGRGEAAPAELELLSVIMRKEAE